MDRGRSKIEGLLADWREGDDGAFDALIPHVYDELHRLAEGYLRQERPDHTLQATAMIHEAYLKLARGPSLAVRDRTHFFALAARIMRRILVDHARRRGASKRGGPLGQVDLKHALGEPTRPAPVLDLLALDEALERLDSLDARKARVIELRYFGGLGASEIAQVLGVSVETVHLDTRRARSWLLELLAEGK